MAYYILKTFCNQALKYFQFFALQSFLLHILYSNHHDMAFFCIDHSGKLSLTGHDLESRQIYQLSICVYLKLLKDLIVFNINQFIVLVDVPKRAKEAGHNKVLQKVHQKSMPKRTLHPTHPSSPDTSSVRPISKMRTKNVQQSALYLNPSSFGTL